MSSTGPSRTTDFLVGVMPDGTVPWRKSTKDYADNLCAAVALGAQSKFPGSRWVPNALSLAGVSTLLPGFLRKADCSAAHTSGPHLGVSTTLDLSLFWETLPRSQALFPAMRSFSFPLILSLPLRAGTIAFLSTSPPLFCSLS